MSTMICVHELGETHLQLTSLKSHVPTIAWNFILCYLDQTLRLQVVRMISGMLPHSLLFTVYDARDSQHGFYGIGNGKYGLVIPRHGAVVEFQNLCGTTARFHMHTIPLYSIPIYSPGTAYVNINILR